MSSMFTSLLPFLKALQRQDMASPQDQDEDGYPPTDQLDSAYTPARSGDPGPTPAQATAARSGGPVGAAVSPLQGNSAKMAQQAQPQANQFSDTKGQQLMQLLQSGLQGSNPNPLQALAPLTQSNPAPPLGVLPDGSLVRDMGYLQNVPSRISGPDVSPDLSISDPNQMRATLSGLMQGIGKNPPPQEGLIYGDKVSPEFLTKTKQISSELGIDPNWLMAVMNFESAGTFSPSVPNAAGSDGVGLIQFTKGGGYTQEELDKIASKTPEDQLDDVRDYLMRHKGNLHSLADVYMTVLWPEAVGKDDDHPLFQYSNPAKTQRAYQQNQGLDRGNKGYVTKADAAASLQASLQQGVNRGTTFLRPDGSSESQVGNKTIVQLPRRPSLIPKPAPDVKPDLNVGGINRSR
jgi:hypothetical protein